MAEDVDTAQCVVLSEAALLVLPRIKPFAEKFYDITTPVVERKDMKLLRSLASEYKCSCIVLGKTILEVSPNARSFDGSRTFQADYSSLVNTILEI